MATFAFPSIAISSYRCISEFQQFTNEACVLKHILHVNFRPHGKTVYVATFWEKFNRLKKVIHRKRHGHLHKGLQNQHLSTTRSKCQKNGSSDVVGTFFFSPYGIYLRIILIWRVQIIICLGTSKYIRESFPHRWRHILRRGYLWRSWTDGRNLSISIAITLTSQIVMLDNICSMLF